MTGSGFPGNFNPGSKMRHNVLVMPTSSSNIAGANTNASWRQIHTIPGGFGRVRAHLFNYDTVNASTGNKVSFSPSESLANLSRPTINGAVDDSQWMIATFSGGGSANQPVASAPQIPSITSSDWMSVKSLVRKDIVGADPLLYVTYYNALTSAANIGYQNLTNPNNGSFFQDYFNALNPNNQLVYFYGSAGGDGVASPGTFGSTVKSGAAVLVAVECNTIFPSWQFCIFGDSTSAGAQSQGYCGAVMQACSNLRAGGLNIQAANFSQSGGTSAQYFGRMQNVLNVTSPNLIFAQGFTVNDSTDYVTNEINTINRICQIIRAAENINAYLLLETPKPVTPAGSGAMSAASVAAYNRIYNFILGCASDNVKIVDVNYLHSNNIGVWSQSYGYDNYHGNDLAHKTEALQIQNIILGLT